MGAAQSGAVCFQQKPKEKTSISKEEAFKAFESQIGAIDIFNEDVWGINDYPKNKEENISRIGSTKNTVQGPNLASKKK